MTVQGWLWSAVIFQVVAAIVFTVAGLVDVVGLVSTSLFLSYVLIVMLDARARVNPEPHVSGREDER